MGGCSVLQYAAFEETFFQQIYHGFCWKIDFKLFLSAFLIL
ncbi:MAG: hypothetical protein RHS_1952 [Robinsoniella sp. RHS]|nr:MAG: hypothetical protein RHS_1952 [Robinsoniella sp. RHS]